MKRLNLINQKFTKLLVISFDSIRTRGPTKTTVWNCICDCGNQTKVQGYKLKNGTTKSCGCIKHACGHLRQYKQTTTDERSTISYVYGYYKHNAKSKKIEFNISKLEFTTLMRQDCFYCGIKPSQTTQTRYNDGKYEFNGVDRINSDLGYVPLNVVPCCKNCNYAKRKLSSTDFKSLISRIYNHWAKL